MLKELPEIGQFVRALKDDFWNEVPIKEDQYITKGQVYEAVGKSSQADSVCFYNENGEQIWIDEDAFFLFELVGDNENKEDNPVTHEFTYPKINLIGSQVHGENFYNDDTYFSFEFKYRGDGDVLFDKLSSLQADIVKLLSERYQ